MKIAICDDHLTDIKKYEEIFQKIAKEHKLHFDLIYYESGRQMLLDFEMNRKQFADIIFLDIYMPEFSGIEAALELRRYEYSGEIVFLTNSKNHMLDAFDVEAFHYIVKNETPAHKVETIFLRVIQKASEKKQENILFTAGGEYRNIAINSIHYFDIYQKIVTVHYADHQSFEFYCPSLEKVEKQVEGLGFIRIHRGYLVSLSKIIHCTYDMVLMDNQEELPVGRKYYPLLKEALRNTNQTSAVV